MIGEKAFKEFCDMAAKGGKLDALFITPTASFRRAQQLDMINMADARDLLPIFKHASNEIMLIGNSTVLLRIAHPYLDRELRGHTFAFINGLEYLDGFEEGARIKSELEARVRL